MGKPRSRRHALTRKVNPIGKKISAKTKVSMKGTRFRTKSGGSYFISGGKGGGSGVVDGKGKRGGPKRGEERWERELAHPASWVRRVA